MVFEGPVMIGTKRVIRELVREFVRVVRREYKNRRVGKKRGIGNFWLSFAHCESLQTSRPSATLSFLLFSFL